MQNNVLQIVIVLSGLLLKYQIEMLSLDIDTKVEEATLKIYDSKTLYH